MRKIQGFCWHIQPIFGYQLHLVHLEQALESGRGEADESKCVKSFLWGTRVLRTRTVCESMDYVRPCSHGYAAFTCTVTLHILISDKWVSVLTLLFHGYILIPCMKIRCIHSTIRPQHKKWFYKPCQCPYFDLYICCLFVCNQLERLARAQACEPYFLSFLRDLLPLFGS